MKPKKKQEEVIKPVIQKVIEKARPEIKPKQEMSSGDYKINLEDLKIDFNLKDTDYQIDSMQNILLQFYLRADTRFRRAFSMNYTKNFIQYMQDKARLREPIHISVMGATRTFTKNDFIFTDKGWRKSDNMRDCQKVLSYNFDLEKYEWQKYELIYRNRDSKERFFEITFSDNRKIILGENHPIFTLNKGWKRAFSLYPDIKIPFFFDFPTQEFKDTISIEKSRIIACLLSCGHMNNSSFKSLDKRDGKVYTKTHHIIGYASGSQEMISFFCDNFEKEYQLRPKLKKKRENSEGIEVEIGNKKIFQELNQFVPSGKKSHIIEIPPEIFNASQSIQKEFIATLFSGDGYVSKEGFSIVEYYTMSDKMAQQIQLILMQYGIIAYIRKKRTRLNTVLNRITITNKDNIIAFRNFVGKLPNSRKNDRLVIHADSYRLHKKKRLALRKFFIKSVNQLEIEDKQVYDIHVENNHNFFLNGILTKNSGKSYTSITICIIHSALNGRTFSIDYICGNSFEFMEKLKSMPEDKLKNSIFLIDEQKNAVAGYGSNMRRAKLGDIQSIIAVNNISTISLTPTGWSNKEAGYGLRNFGRCFKTKTNRMMLYNLQEKGKGGELPLGNIYLPIFTHFAPKKYAEQLEKEYMAKKNEWVQGEMRSEMDVLGEIRMKSAQVFAKDKNFQEIKGKKLKLSYIQNKLGSEWTTKETEDVLSLAILIQQGFLE